MAEVAVGEEMSAREVQKDAGYAFVVPAAIAAPPYPRVGLGFRVEGDDLEPQRG